MDVADFDHVNMVGFYRRGAGWDAVENPPTVMVLVTTHNTCDLKETRESTVQILDRFGLSMVAVDIVKDTIERAGAGWGCPVKLSRDIIRGLPGNSRDQAFIIKLHRFR